MRPMSALPVLLTLLAGIVPGAIATTYVVSPDGSGDFATIQDAIDFAPPGSIIELTHGEFIGPGNRDIDFQGKELHVKSQLGFPEICIIDCEGSQSAPHRGFIFHQGEGLTSILEGVTIRNGWVPGGMPAGAGGGILCLGTFPQLSNLIIENNTSGHDDEGFGGGMYCEDAYYLMLTDVSFRSNRAGSDAAHGYGGGLYCVNSTLVMTRVEFISNLAGGGYYGGGAGGGICAESSVLSGTQMLVQGNTASGSQYSGSSGGGISARHSTLVLTDTEVTWNSAYGAGGGIEATSDDGSINLTDVLVRDCSVSSLEGAGGCLYIGTPSAMTIERVTVARGYGAWGGGMVITNGNPTLRECTFYGNSNSFGDPGSAIIHYGTSLTVENTIIAFQQDGDPVEAYSPPTLICCDVYGNLYGDYVGCIAGQEGINDNFSLDPLFCDPDNSDFQLWSNSPCDHESCGLVGAWPVGCWVEDVPEDMELPREWSLAPNCPNPFSSTTRLSYSVPAHADGAHIALKIYDTTGRLVHTLIEGAQSPGVHSLSWNGADDSGVRLPNGVYFCRLSCGPEKLQRQMVVLR